VHCLTTCLLATGSLLTLPGPALFRAQNKPADNTGGAQVTKAVGVTRAWQADSITMAAEIGWRNHGAIARLDEDLQRASGRKRPIRRDCLARRKTCNPGDRVRFRAGNRRMGTRLPRCGDCDDAGRFSASSSDARIAEAGVGRVGHKVTRPRPASQFSSGGMARATASSSISQKHDSAPLRA